MGKHSEWRKLAKKARRKRIRQILAEIRDKQEEEEQKRREQQPWYQQWLADHQQAEELQAKKDEDLSAELELKWQSIEVEAQRQFRELQDKLAAAREERARQNELIKLEWEKEQQRLNEKRQKEEKELQEKLRKQEELIELVNNFLNNGGDTPEHLKTFSETNPNKELCPFFKKTSTCRFFDVCSRNHVCNIFNQWRNVRLRVSPKTRMYSQKNRKFDKREYENYLTYRERITLQYKEITNHPVKS